MSPTAMEKCQHYSCIQAKVYRAECGNSRGISLLFVSGKVLSIVMLTRLLEHVVNHVLPESQCDLRRGRSSIDIIFVAWQLQEKCCEQHQDIYMAFVDLTKAFVGTFSANLSALPLLLPFYNNFISVCVLKLP